jgi:CheY-like chemotaxis protein
MTIGSAALLPGTLPQAPLSPPQFFGRRRSPAVLPAAAAAPTWRLPVAGLADDPPRGRILVVEDEASVALDIQRVLGEAGYRAVGPAASVEEAVRLMARRAVDAAIVDLQLGGCAALAIADGLAHRAIPFVWLTDQALKLPPQSHADVPSVAKHSVGEELVEALERAMSQGRDPGRESLYPVPPPQSVWPRVFPSL